MSTPTEEMVVELDAADNAAANKAKDPEVVVDPEVSGAAATKETLTTDQGVEKLRKQLEDERSARVAAENRANEASRAEAEARGAAQVSDLERVKGAIVTLTQHSDSLENQLAEANAAQDWKAAAKIQRQMGDNSAKLAQLEEGKSFLEKAPKPTPRPSTDPVEAFCAQLTPISASWVRSHPEFVTNQQKHAEMIAAHELAIARGHKADTEGYFRNIEKTLEVGAPTVLPPHSDDPASAAADPLEADPAQAAAKPAGGRQSTPPAAPPSRGSNGAAGSPRSNTVRLTSDEIEAAHANFPDSKTPLEDYARNKLALKKEGKL